MFSRTVFVTYKGNIEKVEVCCNPNDSYNKVKEMGLKQLKRRDEMREKRRYEFNLKMWGLA